jgi:hypothetical protein
VACLRTCLCEVESRKWFESDVGGLLARSGFQGSKSKLIQSLGRYLERDLAVSTLFTSGFYLFTLKHSRPHHIIPFIVLQSE